PGPLLVPTTVFTEVCMLVERRRGTRAELAFSPTSGPGCSPCWNPRPPTSTVFSNLLRRTPTCRSEQSTCQSSLLPNDLIYRRVPHWVIAISASSDHGTCPPSNYSRNAT